MQDVQLIERNRPGLVGEIVRWHGSYYVDQLGWPQIFETLCAEQLAEIARHLGERDDVAAFSAWQGGGREFLGASHREQLCERKPVGSGARE